MGNHDMEEFDQVIEKLPHLFDTLGENLPKLLKAVKDQVFSPEAGRDLGRAVGLFYKELVTAGIEPLQAMELTKEYMKSMEKFANQVKMDGFSHDSHK